jgi:hypothetical protein
LRIELGYSKIFQHLDNLIFSNKKFNIKDTIIVTGSPRSGTTWLMEILRVIPGYTSVFEPLNPIYFPESFNNGFSSRTYKSSDEDWQIGEEYLRNILSGRLYYTPGLLDKEIYRKRKFPMILSSFIYQLKPEILMHKLFGNKLVVKFVRLNRLLPWLVKRIQLRHIILIIRHPCAVIASQLKTGFCGYHPSFPTYLDIFPDRKTILGEVSKIEGLSPHLLNKLDKIKSIEEFLAVSWCMDTIVPLSYSKPYPWTVVSYEKLIKYGENEINHLFDKIGENRIPYSVYRHLKIPSMLIQKGEYDIVTNVNKQLYKWKDFLSEKKIERIQKIVSAFNIDFYTKDIEPYYEKIEF